jgi:hypothetical protein
MVVVKSTLKSVNELILEMGLGEIKKCIKKEDGEIRDNLRTPPCWWR